MFALHDMQSSAMGVSWVASTTIGSRRHAADNAGRHWESDCCGKNASRLDDVDSRTTSSADGLNRQGPVVVTRWRVDIIRAHAEHLGTVEAADDKEAIEKAVMQFGIPSERKNRVVVQRLSRRESTGERKAFR
jgi:hypothetical protein